MVVEERVRFTARDHDDAYQVIFEHDRDTEHRSVGTGAGIRVLLIGEDVRHVDRLGRDSRSTSRRRSIKWMRMLPVVVSDLALAVMCSRVQESFPEQPQPPVVSFAESPAGFDDLVEHGLEARGADDCMKDSADRAVLLACILELTSEFCAVGSIRRHLCSFSERPAAFLRKARDSSASRNIARASLTRRIEAG